MLGTKESILSLSVQAIFHEITIAELVNIIQFSKIGLSSPKKQIYRNTDNLSLKLKVLIDIYLSVCINLQKGMLTRDMLE